MGPWNPTLAKNARMGHPQFRNGKEKNSLLKGWAPRPPKGLIECPSHPVSWWQKLFGGEVKDNFTLLNGEPNPDETAATESDPSHPLTVFFNPNPGPHGIDYPTEEPTTSYNMAVLFHESLHGFTGKCDNDLQTAFHCTVQLGTMNITDYVEQALYPKSPGFKPSCQ